MKILRKITKMTAKNNLNNSFSSENEDKSEEKASDLDSEIENERIKREETIAQKEWMRKLSIKSHDSIASSSKDSFGIPKT